MLLLILLIALVCDALHVVMQPGNVFVSAAPPLRKSVNLQRRRGGNQRDLFRTWEEAHQAGNLPELEEPVRAPSGDNSVALCTVMKSENSTDVREWLSYYRCVVFCYDYLYSHRHCMAVHGRCPRRSPEATLLGMRHRACQASAFCA